MGLEVSLPPASQVSEGPPRRQQSPGMGLLAAPGAPGTASLPLPAILLQTVRLPRDRCPWEQLPKREPGEAGASYLTKQGGEPGSR